MIYADGNEAMLGDVVAIGVNFNGVVVTSIDNAHTARSTGLVYRLQDPLEEFVGVIRVDPAYYHHQAPLRFDPGK